MEIYWLGHGCFRLRGRDATVITDPCAPATGYKIGKLTADIITVSSTNPQTSYRQAVTGTPKVLSGPGEYEISGTMITALRTNHDPDATEQDRNVAFVLEIDDVRICHLGALKAAPSSDDVEALSGADVLIVPVGGGSVLSAAAAAEVVSRLEPKIVIPMMFKTDSSTATDLDTVDKFLKEMGTEGKQPETRLTVTRSSVPDDTTVVLLNYRS